MTDAESTAKDGGILITENTLITYKYQGGFVFENHLEAIAARWTAGNGIEDPAAWQREVRQDRNLPFHD